MDLRFINAVATLLVMACWPIYIALFVRRPVSPAVETRRDTGSLPGIVLQFSAVVIVWIERRPVFSPLVAHGIIALTIAALAIVLAVASVWYSYSALQTLGRHWTFVARIGSDHVLIQHGPYAVVRHPLYACFFGLTLATAMVWSKPIVLPAAMAFFGAGVWIRIRVEERLLRDRFGTTFNDYVRHVPALFPWRMR